MRSRHRSIAVAGLAVLMLQGCAAALVPVAASGLMARGHLKHGAGKQGARAPKAASVAARPAPLSAPAADASLPSVPAAPPMPSRLSEMKPGTVYVGSLATAAALASPGTPRLSDPATPEEPAAAVATTATASPRQDWGDLIHYVARRYADRFVDSALLERGSTVANPRWVPCGSKLPAVIVDLGSTTTARGAIPSRIVDVLGGLETLQVTVIYTTRLAGPALAGALAGFPARELHPPEADRTLFPVAPGHEPAARARIGALFCVVAIASAVPQDFPNQAAGAIDRHGWHQGWFYVAPAAQR